MMRRAILTDQARTVQADGHGQILQANVMDHLVIGALSKCRIECDNRVHAGCSHAGRHRHRMFFRDPHIEKAFGVYLAKSLESGTGRHGRCDGQHIRIPLCQGDERIAEDRSVRSAAGAFLAGLPVCASKQPTPWNFSGACSAGR